MLRRGTLSSDSFSCARNADRDSKHAKAERFWVSAGGGSDRILPGYASHMHIEAAWLLLQAIGTASFTLQEDLHRLCLYSSLLLPLRSTVYMDKKSKEASVAGYIIRESLKLKASDADTVVNLHNACKKFVELFVLLESDEIPENIRADLEDEFLDFNKASFCGSIVAANKGFLVGWPYDPAFDPTNDSSDRSEGLNRRREMFLRAESAITQLGLDGVWKRKALVDGIMAKGS